MENNAYRYRFGTAEFDEARFELRVAGLPVEVERRALEVLLYLLRHAGEVVSKEELLREVWAGRVTVDKVLPNAINKLRRALGESNAPYLLTQARIGYRLDGPIGRTAVGRPLESELHFEAGQAVPGRPNFRLQELLGRTFGSEVWLAGHARTHERRVYKFSLAGTSLRALKREATLMRVLQESLPENDHFVIASDWNFEAAPYFLECPYGGVALDAWARDYLHTMSVPARLDLFLQIADAVAAAHSVGVLHKDLKPGNVLVMGDTDAPRVRLTDFGSGQLLDQDVLTQLGISRHGMTVEDQARGDTSSGTPMYFAPELFAGHVPTVRSDVFALGLMLYQLLSDRLGQPMASGWEDDVADDLLRELLRRATDGNPDRRTQSAAELAQHLRQLEQRRHALMAQQHELQTAARDREALARSRARRPYILALIASLALGVSVAVWLLHSAVVSREQAQRELARTTALKRFLEEDLVGRANPLISSSGADMTLRQALLEAHEHVANRFQGDAELEVAVRQNLAQLFNTLDLFEPAEDEARKALALRQQSPQLDTDDAFQTRALLARILSRKGRLDEASAELDALQKAAGTSATALQRQSLAAARSTFDIGKGNYKSAAANLRAAIAGMHELGRADTIYSDSLRLDLVAVLAAMGSTDEAKKEGRTLIEDARTRNEHGELLVALTQLSMARSYRDQPGAAEQLLLEARPVILSQLGEKHTRYLQLLGELLSVAFHNNNWPKATEYARLVHERVRDKLGPSHVMTYVSLTNLARTLSESGHPAAAQEKAHEAYTKLQQLAGLRSPQTQDAAFVYALSELDLGNVAAAEDVLPNLDADILATGRASEQWGPAIDALRGIALALRGQRDRALDLLKPSVEALKPAGTAPPERLYVVASRSLQALVRPR